LTTEPVLKPGHGALLKSAIFLNRKMTGGCDGR
jgi:hypothetical protein